MKRCFTFAFTAIILASVLSASGSLRTTSQLELTNEEYAVYSAVITNMFAGNKVTFDTKAPVNLLVIKDQTVNSSLRADHVDYKYLKDFFPEVSPEMHNDFLAKNKESKQIKDLFKIELKRILFNKSEFDNDKTRKDWDVDWERFYKTFPNSGGFIAFSRVTFDPEKRLALTYMEHYCRDLCASGHFMLLKKGEEGWTVVKTFSPWIS